ncbi:MAG TPA: ABC transporter ATP-binding protein [Chitinophagaceae bacterium]|jgi:peptide/nickel transport system ATP-binding protein|nr:ABC transporter ATP-binding protein [Chitinophagaceae bacterium]
MLPLLQIDGLSVDFRLGGTTVPAVRNISLTVRRGEIVALVGESGSGKSVTSLALLQLLPQPPAHYAGGRLLFAPDGQTAVDLLQLPARALQEIRGHRIAMIFQEPMTSLNPVITCGRQVAEALLRHKKGTAAQARTETIRWFERVRLPNPAGMYNRYPHELSGGQKQRVMIAMAMCCEPALLLCDEPTTALDVTVQKTILELIRELQRERNMGVIFITHDLGVVAEIADRVAILYKGELLEEGPAATIFREPSHPYTKALIACRPAGHPRGERLPVVSDFLEPAAPKVPGTMKASVKEEKNHPDKPAALPAEALVEVKNLVVSYPARKSLFGTVKEWRRAVDDVSFTIGRGETVGLVGESGCGKTTLGRTLLRLIEPTSGGIRMEGKDITRLARSGEKLLRKEVQLVFQDPFSSLNPRLTIGSALEEPLQVLGLRKDKAARKKRVAELLEQVNLPSAYRNRYPHEFSGGQRQRIVIARALALEPRFLVCDESVSALDVSVQAQVLNLLNDLKKELGLTLLFISHDLSVVRYMSDRIFVMNRGKFEESGPADEVYHHPRSEYTRQLIAAIPKL